MPKALELMGGRVARVEWDVEMYSSLGVVLLLSRLKALVRLWGLDIRLSIYDCSLEEGVEGFCLVPSVKELAIECAQLFGDVPRVSTQLENMKHLAHYRARRDARGVAGVWRNVKVKGKGLFKQCRYNFHSLERDSHVDEVD